MAHSGHFRTLLDVKRFAVDTVFYYNEYNSKVLRCLGELGELDIFDLYGHVHSSYFSSFLGTWQMGKQEYDVNFSS